MQYSKSMIDLLYEIRRRVDTDTKPSIKLANPEVFLELADYYADSRDAVTRALIKELLHLADQPLERPAQNGPRRVAKVYRGQVELVEAPAPSDEQETKDRRQRVYRGQVVG